LVFSSIALGLSGNIFVPLNSFLMFFMVSAYSKTLSTHPTNVHEAPLNSLMDSTTSPKVKTTEGKGVGARSLTCSTLGVEGRVGAPR
jgi:hypothetical protein